MTAPDSPPDSPTPDPSQPPSLPPTAASTSVPIGEAIRRGWDWVVFVWQLLQRLGGPVEIAKSLGLVLTMMMKRTLTQWGLLKKS